MIYHLTKVVDALEDPTQFIDVRFASFLSGGFITAIVVNPPGKETGKMDLCAVWCAHSSYILRRPQNFAKIFTLLLSYVVPVKRKAEISQNFVVFSEYMNFNKNKIQI